MPSSFPLRSFSTVVLFGLTAMASPALSNGGSQDYRCSALPDQARVAVTQSGDADARQRAQRFIAAGEQLCAVRSEGQAARQFRSALRILGVQEVRPSAEGQAALR